MSLRNDSSPNCSVHRSIRSASPSAIALSLCWVAWSSRVWLFWRSATIRKVTIVVVVLISSWNWASQEAPGVAFDEDGDKALQQPQQDQEHAEGEEGGTAGEQRGSAGEAV